MTDKEKAYTYYLNNVTSDEVYYHAELSEKVRKAFLDGLAEGRKEKCLEQNNDGTIRPCVVIKEIAELKKDKEYLDKVNNEQTEVILKLKEQIEKMKNCAKCKHCDCKN